MRHKFLMVFISIFMTVTGISGCAAEAPSQGTEISMPICTPESPLVNIYRVTPQSWTNSIFEFAFPPIPTPIPPALPPPVNEQQLVLARYAALQQLLTEAQRWSDSKTIKTDDNTREVRITLTFISPELLQAVYLNEVLRDRFLTFGFQDQLQGVLNGVAERNELLFLLTVTATNNNLYSTRHTIRIPIQEMVMHNAEKITIVHSHNDHNLEQVIDTSSVPVFGYLGYPLSLVSADQCRWILDPKYNTNIVITVPFLEVDSTNKKTSYFWTIPYAPLIDLNLPPDLPNFNMPAGFDTNLMAPLATPPSDTKQPNYWQDFASFIWGQVTLGNR